MVGIVKMSLGIYPVDDVYVCECQTEQWAGFGWLCARWEVLKWYDWRPAIVGVDAVGRSGKKWEWGAAQAER